ncbi:MAG: ABC transporter ATP-binding protein [Bacillota bacterium]|nr:ABC transporter ATP-binding protein [Bacillota bacterium]
MLEVENLTVTYPDGTKAVDQVSFTIPKGEHVALIGANGAGKSSLILSLVGVIPSQGKIQVDDVTLSSKTIQEIRKKIGIVFQNPDDQLFLPTIYDDIAFGPRNLGIDEKTIEYRVNDRLQLLGISHLKNKSALKMSGGEKRLAALASILAMKPSIMVLDEPTAFLDPKARRNLINILKSLPHTMLIATHDLTFAKEVCENCIILKKGKVFAQGKSEDLLYNVQLMDEGGVEAIGV